jgi:hypothetical protein
MTIPSDHTTTQELETTAFVPMETLADIERDATLDVSPKKVAFLKGKLIVMPRRPPELGLSEADFVGLAHEGDDE